MIRKIMMVEKDVVDLRDIRLFEPTAFEKHEGRGEYLKRLEICLTDGFRIGFVFDKITTERTLINTLRDMANKIEERRL